MTDEEQQGKDECAAKGNCPVRDRIHIQEHLANERTFLSWIRTAVTILAFGFVIEKFALYLPVLMNITHAGNLPGNRDTAYLGLLLNIVAALLVVLATVRFLQTRRQIQEGAYRYSSTLDLLLAFTILLITIMVAIMLFRILFL